MALPPRRVEGATPTIIEQIKTCVGDPHIGGRLKRDRLAAIASKLGLDATNKPWAGHVLALLCESLDTSVINEVMTHGSGSLGGRYKKEWDKWKLGDALPQWENKRGEDAIRKFVYGLLMKDLISLYEGSQFDGGVGAKGLSIEGVCKKVKKEIGIVVIKDSYLREQLKNHGIGRNLKGQVRRGGLSPSAGSPSTLGHSTPTPIPTTSVSPRPSLIGRLSPSSSMPPSNLPTSIRHASGSGQVSSRPTTFAVTQRPSQSQPSKSMNYYQHGRTHKPSNIKPLQQKLPQNFRDAAPPLHFPVESINPSTTGGEMIIRSGMGDLSHNGQLVISSNLVSSSGENFGNVGSHCSTPLQSGSRPMVETPYHTEEAGLVCNPSSTLEDMSYADAPSNDCNPSFPLPLVLTAEAPLNDAFTQLSEQLKLLNRRLDTERAARDAQANGIVKWKNEYATSVRKSYEELYANQELRIKDLEQAKVSEQTKREKLSDDMETLQQIYHNLDATVQRHTNANGELQSKVLSLESENRIQAEHIDDLQSSLKNLKTKNNELQTDLSAFHNHNDSLRTEVTKLQIENNQLIGGLKKTKNEKLRIERTFEALQQHKDNLQTDAGKLQAENAELRANVRTQGAQLQEANTSREEKLKIQSTVEALQRQKDSFQSEADKLQAENAELRAEVALLHETSLDEKLELEGTIEALQQQKDKLQNKTDNLHAENAKLHAQVTKLQEIMTSLDEKVALLESDCPSLQEETKAPNINATHRSLGHLSYLTFDSAIGESLRGSVASSRKRGSSLTDGHENKRHRSLQPLGDDDATFLPIMPTSGLPFRSGSEGPAHTKDGWV